MKSAKHVARKPLIALNADLMGGDPNTNLALLERTARDSLAFGAELDFDDDKWEIQEGAANAKKCVLWFTVNSAGAASKNVAERSRLREPFATFLKSVVRLMEAAKHRAGNSYKAVLAAGRYLHDELERRGYDPAELTDRDFQQAEAAAVGALAQGSSFLVAQNLRVIAAVVQSHRLSRARINYKPAVKAPGYDYRRLDTGMDPAMLPSAAAMAALPAIAQKLTDPGEICLMRAIELLHCAPWRIGELLSLPLDCEVVTSVDGRLLSVADLDRGVPVRYGLRYRPEKAPRLSSDIKWIPSAAIPLVRRALKDLREHSAAARDAAAYMESNPGRAWLPEPLRERDRLRLEEVADILQCGRKVVREWLHDHHIPVDPEHVLRRDLEHILYRRTITHTTERARHLLQQQPNRARFESDELRSVIGVRDLPSWLTGTGIALQPATISRQDLETKFLSMKEDISPDFPWKLSECLFIFPMQFFSKRRSLLQVVRLMRDSQLRFFLTGSAEAPSIFERHGYTEENGDPIRVTSHIFRRWLATLAMDHEMSMAEVQNWLGHTHDRWTAAYDHRSPDTLGREARDALDQGFGVGPIADIAGSFNSPRDRDTFLEAVLATAHITEYGMCARDWLSQPCVRHGACAACEKQLIRKGDPEHRNAIARNLRENRILLERAKAECEDGQVGAGNHARHLMREVAALEATMAVHEDSSIVDGTYVQLDLPVLLAKAETLP